MADTIRDALELKWTGDAGRQEASIDDLRAVVTRDLHHANNTFFYGAVVYSGTVRVFRSLDCMQSVVNLDKAKQLCEMAIAAELWRRAT